MGGEGLRVRDGGREERGRREEVVRRGEVGGRGNEWRKRKGAKRMEEVY